MQALYQYRLGGDALRSALAALRAAFPVAPLSGEAAAPGDTLSPGALPEPPEVAEDRAFSDRIAATLEERMSEIDAHLRQAARKWRPERMDAVDLSILRLAVAELLEGTAPVRVVLNEAIELARAYGSEQSPAFVNGVLDGVVRRLS